VSKSRSKIKVPKRVAGVKIPKAVRKGPVLQFVNSPAGKLLVAEALTAALAVFAYKQAEDGGERIKLSTRDAEQALKRNTARLTHAFGEGVRAFREALSQPPADLVEEPDLAPNEEVAPVVAAKKNYRRSEGRSEGRSESRPSDGSNPG
jgi:hypothetical protein